MDNDGLKNMLAVIEPGTSLEQLPDHIVEAAIKLALSNVNGVTNLRANQFQTIKDILQKKNIFKTAGTGSGKTLPPCLVPSVLRQLGNCGFKNVPQKPHTLFLTPLNSIRDSLVLQLNGLGISTSILSSNRPYNDSADVHFVTPESVDNVISDIRKHSSDYCSIVFDEVHQFASWAASGFRKVFVSLLYGGVLTMMGVSLLLQTATATVATRTFIKGKIPEVKDWTDRIESPARSDVTLIIPPPSEISGNISALLAPHIEDIVKFSSRPYTTLVIVRSISRGAEVFLEVINKLSSVKKLLIDERGSATDPYNRKVAFYHRNISEERKKWILEDLSRGESDPEKKLLMVVATVALGLGVDISVDRAVIFGLPENLEGVPQEIGRVGRHRSEEELSERRSLVFYFHKGAAENYHCKKESTSRQLITPMPVCQNEQLYRNFDETYKSIIEPCHCCYPHIKSHFDDTGCANCKELLFRFCGKRQKKPSIVKKIKAGIEEFCESRKLKKISSIHNDIEFSIKEFSDDLVKIYDEISSHLCLVKYYGIPVHVANIIFTIIQESMNDNYDQNDDFIIDSDNQYETFTGSDIDSNSSELENSNGCELLESD